MENTKALEVARKIASLCSTGLDLKETLLPDIIDIAEPLIQAAIDKAIADLRAQLAEAQSECEEQARLNGMGSEREALLNGRITRLERQLAERDVQLAAVQLLVDAAHGLSHGVDWNKGNHAMLRGYRQKLLNALPAAICAIDAYKATRQPTQDNGE